MTRKTLELYDPGVVGNHLNARIRCLDMIFNYIKDEHLTQKGSELIDESSWRRHILPESLPKQPNSDDCGVFVSAFIYHSACNTHFRLPVNVAPIEFAADLRFQFVRSMMNNTIHNLRN